jgi:outer membrane protein
LLPEQVRKEKELEITTLQLELRTYQSKKFGVGGELFRKRKELIQPIQRKVYNAIKSLANDYKYSFVLDKSKNSNILYADPKYDKSDLIIRKLKSKK